MYYSISMPRFSTSHIQNVLSQQIPELGLPKDSSSLLVVISVFIFALCASSGLGVLFIALIDFGNELELSSEVYIAVAILAPLLGFGVGYLTNNSDGWSSSLNDRWAERDRSSLGYSRRHDREIFDGCALFLFQAAGGFVYATGQQLYQHFRPTPGASALSDLELATSIVVHLVDNGSTSIDDLTESLAAQGVDRLQLTKVVGLLRQGGLFDLRSLDNLSIKSDKIVLFGD